MAQCSPLTTHLFPSHSAFHSLHSPLVPASFTFSSFILMIFFFSLPAPMILFLECPYIKSEYLPTLLTPGKSVFKRPKKDQRTMSRAQFQGVFKCLTTSPFNQLSLMSNSNPSVHYYYSFSHYLLSHISGIKYLCGYRTDRKFNPK